MCKAIYPHLFKWGGGGIIKTETCLVGHKAKIVGCLGLRVSQYVENEMIVNILVSMETTLLQKTL